MFNITLSNKITISRIIMAFIFIYFLYFNYWIFRIVALAIFILASFTDYFDGYIARRRKEITVLGIFMDPIADKILVFAALLSFIDLNLVAGWMVIIILSRDFIINGLRFLAAKKGKVLSSNQLAKHKTFSQMLIIFLILLGLTLRSIGLKFLNIWTDTHQLMFEATIFILMIIMVVLSLFSGITYLYVNRDILVKKEHV